MNSMSAQAQKRWLMFGCWVLLTLTIFATPFASLMQLAWQDETASHILLIPFITAWLLYTEPKGTTRESGYSIRYALLFVVPGVILGIGSLLCADCAPKSHLSLYILSLILFLISGFVLFLGDAKAKASFFPLALLLFMVPIPDVILNKTIYWLQSGSADIAEILFNLSGAPVLRDGFAFHLPKMSIEVAAECSGIRSSLALLILALLVAHFAFRPLWKKAVFIVAGLAMMLIKNGIRIATLTLLANYVDPDFLYGKLHHRGGVVFFLIGLALLLPVYWWLRKGEERSRISRIDALPSAAGARK